MSAAAPVLSVHPEQHYPLVVFVARQYRRQAAARSMTLDGNRSRAEGDKCIGGIGPRTGRGRGFARERPKVGGFPS